MKGLLCIAHGSRREQSNLEFTTMVMLLKPRLHETYTLIDAAFLEFSLPSIDTALDDMIHNGMQEVHVYPFFLNSGKHVHHDIPEYIEKFKKQYPDVRLNLLKHFGSSEHILELIEKDLKEY